MVQENVSGARVVKAFTREEYEINRFDNANTDLMTTNLKVQKLLATLNPILMIIMNASVIAIIMIGGFSSAVLLFYETLNLAKMSISLFLMVFGWAVIGLLIERKIHFMIRKNREFL